jgi:hypothetical protein
MKEINMRFICLVFPLQVLLVFTSFSQEDEWITYYEKSGYTSTPGYDETIRFAQNLANQSTLITYTTFGMSPQGRELPMLIVDKSGKTDIEGIKADDKAIVLIQACIHAGESDGKDAGLMLLRDMAINWKHLALLDNVTILFVPIFNVDGHERFGRYNRINQNGPDEMGWRATAQRLNLNRDYLKADAPEMQAMIDLYHQWLPDFYIDCHVTDGADYVYPLTYGLQMIGNLNESQTNWLKDTYLPFVTSEMENSGQPIAPYMDFVQWHNPKSGIKDYFETPRYSGGYAAINNRPTLLIETHMLKDYKTRVTAAYDMILSSLMLIAETSNDLIKLNQQADMMAANLFNQDSYTLTYKLSQPKAKFLYRGYKYSVEKSELSGGNWYQYSNQPEEVEIDLYHWEPDVSVKLPMAYIIPPQWTEIIEKLKLHHVELRELGHDSTLEIGTYRFENVQWNQRPFEGRIMLDYNVKPITKRLLFPAGSVVVSLNQPRAQVIIHLLEPEAPDALVKWGFLNSIFEQKEYAESYVLEDLARKMLRDDPKLKEEFEVKMNNDTEFASSPRAILNWFYQWSPYWDDELNVYPIGRIVNK